MVNYTMKLQTVLSGAFNEFQDAKNDSHLNGAKDRRQIPLQFRVRQAYRYRCKLAAG